VRYYDNTRVEAYRDCPRKYFLRHIKGWVPNSTAIALINGSAWHDAMDIVWGHAKDDISDRELAQKSLQAYVDRWTKEGLPHPRDMTLEQQDQYSPRGPHCAAEVLLNYVMQRRRFIKDGEVLAIERPFIVPLYDDNDKILYIGRLDKVFRSRSEGEIVIEHKTTTQFYKTSGLRKSYLESFSPNSQVDGYGYAARFLYPGIRGIWIDISVFNKTVTDQFKFLPVDRQFAMLDGWLNETRNWIERIESERASYATHGLKRAFPKNTSHCGSYGGCTYRDICKFYTNPDSSEVPSGFKVDFWNPFDVLHLQQLGLEPEKVDG